jgi:hypothetical protein
VSLREVERQQIIEVIESDQALPQKIRAVVLDRGTVPFDKRREIAGLIENALRERGSFLRTADGRLFFFSKDERKVLDVEQTEFRRTLTQISGLSVTENFLKFSLDVLQAKVSKTAPLAEVHTLSSFNAADGFLAVSDGAGGMWTRPRGGDWWEARNGDDGIFFLTEPETIPFVPEFQSDGAALQWYLGAFLFGRDILSTDDAQVLLSVFLFHQFFPPLRHTRVIPAFLGPQGSGKSTGERLIGRLLLGHNFEVSGLQRDREDAFIAALSNRVILGVDNADSRIPWLPDALALYATGQRFRLRRLYSTNEEVSYTPRSILLVSSRDPQFNRPDVSERLLPFHFARPENYQAEHILFRDLDAPKLSEQSFSESRRSPIYFRTRNRPPFRSGWPTSQHSDSAFSNHQGNRMNGSRCSRRSNQRRPPSPRKVAALRLLIEREGDIEDVAVGDLFKRVRRIGETEPVPLPRTAQGFGRYLSTHKRVIELELGLQIAEIRHGGGIRAVTLKRRQP